MKKNFKSIIVLAVVVLAVIVGVALFSNGMSNEEELTYGELVELFEEQVDFLLVYFVHHFDAQQALKNSF